MKGKRSFAYFSVKELEDMKKKLQEKILQNDFVAKDKIMIPLRDSNLKRIVEIDRELRSRGGSK